MQYIMEIIYRNKLLRPWGGAPYSLLQANETRDTRRTEMEEEETVLIY